ncbi:MAG: DUF2101 family protein [archaeon]
MSKKNALIKVLQAVIFLNLVLAIVLFSFNDLVFLVIPVVLTIVFLYFLFKLLKSVKEKTIYFAFFFVLMVLTDLAWAGNFLLQSLSIFNYYYLIAVTAGLLVFIGFLRFAVKKNYCKGKVVLSDDKTAVIETDYDLTSFVKAGKFVVKTNKKLKVGATVKLKIKQGIFSVRPTEVVG